MARALRTGCWALLGASAVTACRHSTLADHESRRVHDSESASSAPRLTQRNEPVQGESSAQPPVFGAADVERRRALATSGIAEVALATGGRSVSFKLTLEDGTRALYKPEQSFAAHWYAELAAYYLDRLLGYGRVPPAIGRKLPWSLLRDAAQSSKHAGEVRVEKGSVRGAMIWWVPDELVPLDPPLAWPAWLRLEPGPRVSPFQRVADFRRALQKSGAHASTLAAALPPPSFAERPAELSDLILFDYLTGNHDRWGGNFTNVRTLAEGGPLIAIDNANGFPPSWQPDAHTDAKLAWVQQFRQRMLVSIRRTTPERLRMAVAEDPLAPLLSDTQLADFERRRRRILDHASEVQRRFGHAAIPW